MAIQNQVKKIMMDEVGFTEDEFNQVDELLKQDKDTFKRLNRIKAWADENATEFLSSKGLDCAHFALCICNSLTEEHYG